ncbi:MAG: replication factor A1 [Candidatus Woesearchaeota archaeon]|jgi:replication factor A1
MKISDLKARSPVDEITLQVESMTEPREVRGGSLKVSDAQCKDDTGTVTVTLWNQEIDKVKTGDTIKITKGWTNEFQGKLQLSAGKFGQLEVVGASDAPAEEAPKEPTDVDHAIDEDII